MSLNMQKADNNYLLAAITTRLLKQFAHEPFSKNFTFEK